jgi:DNA-binding XRE family transcriptional regulator
MSREEHKRLTGRKLHVHRLLPGSPYDEDGCVTLCRFCHDKSHFPSGNKTRKQVEENKVFAARLRQTRKQVGLSQYGLAKTRQAVSQLEMGQSEPGWTTVQLLALALGVDYSELAEPDLKLPEVPTSKPRGRPRTRPGS